MNLWIEETEYLQTICTAHVLVFCEKYINAHVN